MQLENIEEASPALFENRKKSPNFGKKGHDCIHYWAKFSIQDIVLRLFKRKKVQNVSLRVLFFFVFLTKY